MSQIEAFKEKAMEDPSLRADLSSLAGKSQGELIAGVSSIAARYGFSLSEDEIASALNEQLEGGSPRDLDEADLDRVAAGSCQDELPGFGYPPNTFVE